MSSSERLHNQMWLHRFDIISLSYLLCLVAIICEINTTQCDAVYACRVCNALWQTVQLGVHRPLSRRLDRCDRVIQNESRDPFGGNVYYVTMQITFVTRKFRNGERNLHCDVVHITTKWVSSLTLDCNGVFAIKAYETKFTSDLNLLWRACDVIMHFRFTSFAS